MQQNRTNIERPDTFYEISKFNFQNQSLQIVKVPNFEGNRYILCFCVTNTFFLIYNEINYMLYFDYSSRREAARICRGKKKEYIKCLENRVAVLENQNKALIEELKSLKDLYCSKGL